MESQPQNPYAIYTAIKSSIFVQLVAFLLVSFFFFLIGLALIESGAVKEISLLIPIALLLVFQFPAVFTVYTWGSCYDLVRVSKLLRNRKLTWESYYNKRNEESGAVQINS